jgi:hypothetical protein
MRRVERRGRGSFQLFNDPGLTLLEPGSDTFLFSSASISIQMEAWLLASKGAAVAPRRAPTRWTPAVRLMIIAALDCSPHRLSTMGLLSGARQRRHGMRIRRSKSIGASAAMISPLLFLAGVALPVTTASAQAPATSGAAAQSSVKTPWGDPDLQGIWTDETDTPFQRSPKFANQEFFTEAQRAEFDRIRSDMRGRDNRGARGSERDVSGAYNNVWGALKRTSQRTSMIVDPPDGRIPAMTPEAQKATNADRDFRLALMQATQTCKLGLPGCAGGTFIPTPTSRRAEYPPRYNTARMNRHDSPEDGALADRCLTPGLPEFGAGNGGGSFRRIVQTPGGIAIAYDVGQGQGWQRSIVMNGSPHLPADIRQWFGDSRGHWEGDTLVIDVTNFSPKTDYRGSRENLHLVERWTRTAPDTLQYVATIEDPTVWTKPWTVKQEFKKQNDQENRIYYEPRCVEGNFGFPAMMKTARQEDRDFAEGRGPDPLTRDNASGFQEPDPLQQ